MVYTEGADFNDENDFLPLINAQLNPNFTASPVNTNIILIKANNSGSIGNNLIISVPSSVNVSLGKCVIDLIAFPSGPGDELYVNGTLFLFLTDFTDAITLASGLNIFFGNNSLDFIASVNNNNTEVIIQTTSFSSSIINDLNIEYIFDQSLGGDVEIKTEGIGIDGINKTLYNQIKKELSKQKLTLYPCGAIAGVYASVDRTRGVWKAPANISLNRVIAPSKLITSEDQESLNIDATSGKSINAIRNFFGKGNLVWGARTLAGNDNEWRYVNVRRLFIFMEESIQKATEFVVFEPNDANTWNRVKGMIENFLTKLWREGALAGAKPDEAFFVNVGLGTTMTSDEILNGIMNVEIGVAAVRPAEFIVLKFSHKLQVS